MVSKHGFAKILDFGLAKLVTPEDRGGLGPADGGGRRDAARAWSWGRSATCRPSRPSGRPLDFRSDQFSFGSILYEMATGKRAFERGTTAETLTAIIREEPEPVAQLNPQMPAPVRWLVERCLSKDPEDRFGTTKDLARDLADVRDHLSEAPVSTTRIDAAAAAAVRAPRRRPGRRAGGVAGSSPAASPPALRRPAEGRARRRRRPSASSRSSAARSIRRALRARRPDDPLLRAPGRAGRSRSSSTPHSTAPSRGRSASRAPTCWRSRASGEMAVSLNRHFIGRASSAAARWRASASRAAARRARSWRTSSGPTGPRTARCSPSFATSGRARRLEYPIGKVALRDDGLVQRSARLRRRRRRGLHGPSGSRATTAARSRSWIAPARRRR